jgi:hypothetical protein
MYTELIKAAGSHRESRDCTVRALAACYVSLYDVRPSFAYAWAHRRLALAGRKPGRGFRGDLRAAYRAAGVTLTQLAESRAAGIKTVLTAARKLTNGTYLLDTSGHVAALVDGLVCDWSRGRRLRVRAVYCVSK